VWGGDDSVRGNGRRSEGPGSRAGREYTFPEILVSFLSEVAAPAREGG